MTLLVGWYFRRSTVQLYKQALGKLAQGDLEGALAAVPTLRKRQFSGAYELEGRVFRAQGKPEMAALALEEGTRAAPLVWVLHSLLGSTYADLGRLEEALNAYVTALDCPGIPESAVEETRRNRAIVLELQTAARAGVASRRCGAV